MPSSTHSAPNPLPISVLMPLFNDETHVVEALSSLTRGGQAPAEIIVVDNASSDSSLEVVHRLCIPGLRIIRNDRNVGATIGRAQAYEASTQEFVAWLDSDDRFSETALTDALDSIRAHHADISLFDVIKTAHDGRSEVGAIRAPREVISGTDALALSLGKWEIHAVGLFRREAWDRAVRQFEPHGFSDDEYLSRLLLANATRIVGNGGTYYYRQVSKPYNFTKVVGQTITNIRSVALGVEQLGPSHPATRAMRDVVVRNLVGLYVRAIRGEGHLSRVADLHRQMGELGVLWRSSNLSARVAERTLSCLLH